MTFDVILVTYNSEKWMRSCIAALAKQSFPLSQINLYVADNASQDAIADTIAALQNEYTGFGTFSFYRSKKNGGFGYGCNRGAALGKGDYVFLLNTDTEVFPDCFEKLAAFIETHPDGAAFECRQLPYETGHHYDPVTLETNWASGAALAVKRGVYEKIGGFDEHLFMYCEDVDLSWRIRAQGQPIYYVPSARLIHHVKETGEGPTLSEYSNSFLNNLLLRYKFASFAEIRQGEKEYLHELRYPRHYDGVRRVFLKNYLRHFAKLWAFWFWRLKKGNDVKKVPYRFKNGFDADRGRALWKPLERQPLISVVVRTCGRPAVLRRTLESLRYQTYQNFEVIVVEDGEPTAQSMVESEFSDLPLRYYASGTRKGRGKNGNTGLAMAKGEYCNFLDDDDYFYADHLELMAQKAAEHPEADLVLGCAMAMMVNVKRQEPYEIEVKEVIPMRFDRVDIFTMCQACRIPIQTVLFKKSLYEKLGGLHEGLEGNEDWAMWLKYLAKGNRIQTKHIDVERATSLFVQPADANVAEKRLNQYKKYDEAFFHDPDLKFEVSLADMRGYYQDMLQDMAHLYHTGQMEEYLSRNLKG